MALVDKERYNLLYKPDLRPTRNWRSEATFEEPETPTGVIPPEIPPEDILEELKELEELAEGLPGLEPVVEVTQKLRQRAEILKIEEELEKLIPKESSPKESPSPYIPGTPGVPIAPTVQPYSPIPVTTPPGDTVPPAVYRQEDTVPGSSHYYPSVPETETPDIREVESDSYTYTKDIIPETGKIIVPEEEPFVPVGTNVDDPNALIEGLPTSFVPTTNITVSVETPKTLVQFTQDAYKKDQIDLQKFYVQKMRMALQRYFHHLLGLTAELSLSNPDMLTKNYDGDQVTGISANSRHLHDTIIRSQIQRLQKARLFKKMANADQTVTHMRTWNATEKERERYYEEAYGNSDNFVDSESNALLRQARSDYDAAYKLALYNMYKYLDASVKLTEDILDHSLTEAKAKAKLIKEGVDIFKTEEVTVSNADNAVQQLQPKTKEMLDAENQSESNSAQQDLTPEDVDKARGIEDPDENFELAPSGGHYSRNDIDYLCNTEPELYSRDTPEGRQHIKETLNLSDKYMSVKEEDNNVSAENPSNQGPTTGNEATVTEESKKKVEQATGSQNPVDNVSLTGISYNPNEEGISLTPAEVNRNKSGTLPSGDPHSYPMGNNGTSFSESTANGSSSLTGSSSNVNTANLNGFLISTSGSKTRQNIKITNPASGLIIGVVVKKNGVITGFSDSVIKNGADLLQALEDRWGSNWNTEGYGVSQNDMFTITEANIVFDTIKKL